MAVKVIRSFRTKRTFSGPDLDLFAVEKCCEAKSLGEAIREFGQIGLKSSAE